MSSAFNDWTTGAEDKIAVLEDRARKAKQRVETAKARAKEKERKLDTRRRILLGAWVLEKMKRDEAFAATVRRELDRFLKRDADRAAFGMRPLDVPAPPPAEEPQPTGGSDGE